MWIRGVDIPPVLIDAHKNGTLVLFVGAGASMGAPASLPNFEGLVERIRDESSLTAAIGDVKGGPLDEILGRMEDDHGVPVHARIAHHIGNPDSRPNETHEAIARLASAGQPRIVTTNYDEHLTSLLSPAVPRYFAPALRMGDDFSGLVYLHGAISEGPDALIATDRDFGRAYLKDAWAARFLERMFSKYTVLFIGYSHNDVIMKYLARGLGRAEDRFILTPDPHSRLWKLLGIMPIEYPTPGGSHDALRGALDGWASHASMRLLDHRERIKSIVTHQVPPLTPESRSYLESILAEEEKVKYFTDVARDPAWLWWAAGRPEFQMLFQPHAATDDEVSFRLATWFAQSFVTEEQSGVALAVLRASGGRLGPVLAYEVGRRLHSLPTPLPAQLRPWLLLGMRDAPPQRRPSFFDFILSEPLWTEDHVVALYLFTHLTEPEPYLVPGLFDDTRLEVGLKGDDYWLRDAWQKVYLPNLSEAAAELLPIVDHHLRKAHLDLAIAEESPADRWPSASRTGIEPNPGDEFPSPLGFLIDAARDCLEYLLQPVTDQALTQLASWTASDLPLLRRLAIHGWIERQDKPAAEKLSWQRGPREFTQTVAMVLADAQRQGAVARNVAEHVDPVAVGHRSVDTYTEAEVQTLLAAIADDRLAHAWELALCGLRRGEIGGLRWMDIDLEGKTLSITNNRVDAGGKAVENDPKSVMSRRTLPLPDRLVTVLKAAKKRQAADRLALGRDGGSWDYVVSNEVGEPYHPQVLSRYWQDAVKAAGLRPIKLHAARHTAATHMHLQGVPIAVVAAWIGHKDASLTMRLYAHSQDDALKAAGDTFDRVVIRP